MSILMIIFVVVFSFWFVKKYFEVQLYSIFNLDDNLPDAILCSKVLFLKNHSSMHNAHLVNGHVVYVYWIDTVYVHNNLPTEFSKRTIFIV